MARSWVLVSAAVLLLAAQCAAENTYKVTVPLVVAKRLSSYVETKLYDSIQIAVRQGCRQAGKASTSFFESQNAVVLEKEEKVYSFEVADCPRTQYVYSLEVKVMATKGDRISDFSCGADPTFRPASVEKCCNQVFNYRFAGCESEDLPGLGASTYLIGFNKTNPLFKDACTQGQARVHQYCSFKPGDNAESRGEWQALNCSQPHMLLTAPPCDKVDEKTYRTVSAYEVELRTKEGDRVQSCFGRSTTGVPDPAELGMGWAGNRRIFVNRMNILSCPGEVDERLLSPEEKALKAAVASGGQASAAPETSAAGPVAGGTDRSLEGAQFVGNFRSCQAILDQLKSADSGLYVLTDPADGKTFRAYCDMKTNGGGWMLAFKQTQYGSGSANGSTNARGDELLTSTLFDVQAGTSDSLLYWGEVDSLMFLSGESPNNWFVTGPIQAYQNWTDQGVACWYRPKRIKELTVSPKWDSSKTAIWGDMAVQFTTTSKKTVSGVVIGRYSSDAKSPECVNPQCSAERHGRSELDCATGNKGVGNWLVFTRAPKRQSQFIINPVLDRLAGVYTSPVFWYTPGWSFSGAWSFDTRATLSGDFNGDGLADYCHLGATYAHFFISKGNGQFFQPYYNFPKGMDFSFNEDLWTSLKATDVDGDGRVDIVRLSATSIVTFLASSAASCWNMDNKPMDSGCFVMVQQALPSGWSFSGNWRWNARATVQGDFNGDGKQDFARLGPQYIHFFISKGNGTFWTPQYPFEAGVDFGWDENTWTSFKPSDVNGDGRSDIMRSSGTTLYSYLSAGNNQSCWYRNDKVGYDCLEETQFSYPYGWNFAGWEWTWNSPGLVQGDFNGDGLADFARVGARYTHIFIGKGNGQFFTPIYNYPDQLSLSADENSCQTFEGQDYDGDGRTDFIKSCGRSVYMFFSRGDQTECWSRSNYVKKSCFKLITYTYPYGWDFSGWWNFNKQARIYADVNGDGKGDWVNLMGYNYAHVFMSRKQELPQETNVNLGQLDTPIHRYKDGWSFSGAWDMNSRATLVGDFDGDGISDYCRLGGQYIHFFISKGDGSYFMPVYYFPSGWNFGFDEGTWTSMPAMDLNGDGRADIVRTYYTYLHNFIGTTYNNDTITADKCWRHDNNVPANCLTINTFNYPNGWNFNGWFHWTQRTAVVGDFNGDGKKDFAHLSPQYIHFFISKGDGQFWYPVYYFPDGWNFGWDEWTWNTLTPADYDGDGRTDILRTYYTYHHGFYPSANDTRCWFVNDRIPLDCMTITYFPYPNGWSFYSNWHFMYKTAIFGDFNGDGRSDYGLLGAEYIHFFISKGNGQFWTPIYRYPAGWNFGWWNWPWVTVPQADFDGDGRTDVIRTYGTYQHTMFMRGTQEECWYRDDNPPSYMPSHCITLTAFTYPNNWGFWGYWQFDNLACVVGDFNGDGKSDYLNLKGDTYAHQFLSRPTARALPDKQDPTLGQFDAPLFWYRPDWNMDGVYNFNSRATVTGDFNGDGRSDYARVAGRGIYFFIAKGDATFHQPYYPFPNGWDFGSDENSWTTLRATDLNGDGRSDIVRASRFSERAFIMKGSNDQCWYVTGTISTDNCIDMPEFKYPSGWDMVSYWGWTRWNYRETIEGDFNGDGKGDHAHVGDTSIRFFISKGDGTYWTPTYQYVGYNFGWDEDSYATLRPMDVNGDGKDDILRTHPRTQYTHLASANASCWTRNDVMPTDCYQIVTFTYPDGWTFWYSWSFNSWSVVQGDFNGDGKDDYCRLGGQYIHFFISKGNGDWYTPIFNFPNGWNFGFEEYWWTTITNIQWNDFDGDGKTDIVRSSGTYNHMFFPRGDNGRCWYRTHRTGTIPLDCMAITAYGYPHYWNFVYGWNFYSDAMVVGDFNGDKKADYINLRGNRYAHQFMSLPNTPVVDLNKPIDQWTTPTFNYKSGYNFVGNWQFNARATITGDFNGDGKTDYARLGDKLAYFFISKGDGTWWQPVWKFQMGLDFGWNENSWTTFPALDLNGDGRMDFIRSSNRFLYAFITDGVDSECFTHNNDMASTCFKMVTFHYPGTWDFQGSLSWNHPAARVGDFNGDGKDDFVRLGATFAYFFISKGNGEFYSPLFYYPNGLDFGWNEEAWTTLPPADFDGDGRDDIIRTAYTQHYGFYGNTSAGDECWKLTAARMPDNICFSVKNYKYKDQSFSGGEWGWQLRSAQVADFDGDGKADIFHAGGDKFRFFISKGNGDFWAPIYSMPTGWNFGADENYWTTLKVADYDGDGKADVLRSYYTYHHGFWTRGDAKRCWNTDDTWPEHRPFDCMQVTAFTHPFYWSFNGGWSWNSMAIVYGDFNGDGRTDYLNLGGGTYHHEFLAEDD